MENGKLLQNYSIYIRNNQKLLLQLFIGHKTFISGEYSL